MVCVLPHPRWLATCLGIILLPILPTLLQNSRPPRRCLSVSSLVSWLCLHMLRDFNTHSCIHTNCALVWFTPKVLNVAWLSLGPVRPVEEPEAGLLRVQPCQLRNQRCLDTAGTVTAIAPYVKAALLLHASLLGLGTIELACSLLPCSISFSAVAFLCRPYFSTGIILPIWH